MIHNAYVLTRVLFKRVLSERAQFTYKLCVGSCTLRKIESRYVTYITLVFLRIRLLNMMHFDAELTEKLQLAAGDVKRSVIKMREKMSQDTLIVCNHR